MALEGHAAGDGSFERAAQVAAFWAHAVPIGFFYFFMRWEGIENVPLEGPAVLAPNHVSLVDPSVVAMPVCWARRGRLIQYVAAEDQFDGAFGGYMRFFSTLSLRRGEGDWQAYRNVLAALRAGRLLGVFPEGGVSRDGRMRPFRSGAAWIALQAGVPLVPVSVNGTYAVWPRERRFPRPGRCEVVYHPPIDCGSMMGRRHDRQAVEEVTRRLEEAVASRYRGPGSESASR